MFSGRGSRIWTCDLKYPKLPRYQAALYPVLRAVWLSCEAVANKGGRACAPRAPSSLLRRDDADVKLAQLLRRRGRRRAHEQVLGALVHGEKRDFAQVLLAREQHHDAVHARRHAPVRRGAIVERAIHAAKPLDHRFLAVARALEGLQ